MNRLLSNKLFHSKAMHLMCLFLSVTQSICFHYQVSKNIVFGLLVCISSFLIFEIIFVLLHELLMRKEKKHTFFCKHESFFFYVCVLLICWLPHLLLWFPGGISADSAWQIEQILHVYQLTTHHPIINSVLIGIFVRIGTMIGNAKYGVFLYVTLQTIFSAFVMAYTLQTMKDLHSKTWMRMLALVLYAFMPNYTGFVAVVLKDMIYSMFFVLMITLIVRYEVNGKSEFRSIWKILLWVFAVFGVLSMRNNGIHIVILAMLYFVIHAMRKKNDRRLMICAWMIPLVLFMGVNSLFNRYFKPIDDDTYASTLSIPLQQTARYAKYYGDEVTQEEYDLISTVLPYEELGDAYNPVISDPVKILFKMEASTSDALTYLKGWALQLPKHFGVYVDATLEQNQFFFDLSNNHNSYYAIDEVYAYDKPALDQTGIIFSEDEITRQSQLDHFYQMIDQIPVLRLFNNLAFYNVLFCFLIAWTIFEKRKEYLYMIPLLLQCLVNFAGPTIYLHQRYFFPIIFTIPMLLGIYARGKYGKEEE